MSFVVREVEFNGEDFDVNVVEADETNLGEVVYAIECAFEHVLKGEEA